VTERASLLKNICNTLNRKSLIKINKTEEPWQKIR